MLLLPVQTRPQLPKLPAQMPASVGKVAIELFHQKPENVELYNTLVNKFMEENPDIQVNVTWLNPPQLHRSPRVAAGNIPQLVSVFPWSASYKDMFREGLFMDLTIRTL